MDLVHAVITTVSLCVQLPCCVQIFACLLIFPSLVAETKEDEIPEKKKKVFDILCFQSTLCSLVISRPAGTADGHAIRDVHGLQDEVGSETVLAARPGGVKE